MTGPTKAELEQQVGDLERQLRDVGRLTEAAKTVSALATWDREARTISRCVKAMDDLTSDSSMRTMASGAEAARRVVQYLATRYRVPMADPDAVEQLINERAELERRVMHLEQIIEGMP